MAAAFLPRKPRRKPVRIGLGMLAVLLLTAPAGGCHRAPQTKTSKIAEVVVTTPVVDEVTDYQDFTGRMDALKTVDIRPRVSGYITDAPFVEGDIVKEGDLLFQIDPRPYEAELNQTKANQRLAEADVVLQTKRAARAMEVVRSGAVSPEDVDQLIAARDKAIAQVGAMKASVERAQLNLDFTHVKVPPLRDDLGRKLVGRISRRMVDPGNLVNADQTILTTLVSIDPMYAYFDVDERTYLELAALTSQGSDSWFSALKFPVLMRLATEDEFTSKGQGSVNFLDNRLNSNTGTVRMRGLFLNPTGVLKSGLFVRIRLPLGVPYKTLMIPDEALLSDQGKKYVLVVKKEKNDKGEETDKVEYRSVELGQSLQGLRAIKSGLSEGDRVIVSGMQRVRPGAVVQVKMKEAPSAPKSSLTAILRENHGAKPIDPHVTPAVLPTLKTMPRLREESRPSDKGSTQRTPASEKTLVSDASAKRR